MDLKFNSWSIYQTDFIANSGQRGITDHGSDGSLLLVPGSRYLWSSGDPWPHMLAAVFKVRRWFVQIQTRNSYNYRADWRLRLTRQIQRRRYDCECQLKGETFCSCPWVCWVLCVMWICVMWICGYICWLVACVRVFTFPRLASTTVCMTGALSAVCCHRPLSPGLSLSVKL